MPVKTLPGRYIMIVALAAALLLSIGQARAGENVEWGLGEDAHALDETHENLNWGFRGLAWGTSFDDVEEQYDLVCNELSDVELSCHAKNAVHAVDEIPLVYVRFVFLDEAFTGISLKYDEKYYKPMLKKLLALLGDPTAERESFPVWELPMISAWASNTHFALRKRPDEPADEVEDTGEEKPEPKDSATF